MTVLTNPKERARFLRFAFVGAIGAVIDFGVFNLLVHFTGINSVIASVISFICAVCSNFIWNRYWTYPDSRTKHVTHQLLQFIVISVIGLDDPNSVICISGKDLLKFLLRHRFHAPFTPTFLGHNISLAVAIIVVMFWNFFANRYWTYGDVD